jgi:hypothetical protein
MVLTADRREQPVLISVRASRFGDGLLVNWRYHDGRRRLLSHLDRVQHLGETGWAEWDLVTGRATWSEQAYRILRRKPEEGPVRLTVLPRYAVPEDAPALTAAIRRLIHHKEPIDVTVRLHRGDQQFPIHLTADPMIDNQGRTFEVHAAIRRIGTCDRITSPASDAGCGSAL